MIFSKAFIYERVPLIRQFLMFCFYLFVFGRCFVNWYFPGRGMGSSMWGKEAKNYIAYFLPSNWFFHLFLGIVCLNHDFFEIFALLVPAFLHERLKTIQPTFNLLEIVGLQNICLQFLHQNLVALVRVHRVSVKLNVWEVLLVLLKLLSKRIFPVYIVLKTVKPGMLWVF